MKRTVALSCDHYIKVDATIELDTSMMLNCKYDGFALVRAWERHTWRAKCLGCTFTARSPLERPMRSAAFAHYDKRGHTVKIERMLLNSDGKLESLPY